MTGGGSSLPEVQRLLAVLSAGRRVAELGTAFGEGAAAIASTAASLVTVEIDETRAAQARERLAGLANVELHVGDWREFLPVRAPFDLVFLDSGDARADPAVVELVAPGGLVVKDDLTPEWEGEDPVRAFWTTRPDFVAAEVLTTPASAALIAVRRLDGGVGSRQRRT